MLATLPLLAVRCGRKAQTSPDALYHSIEQRFISGELAQADGECIRAAPLINASDPLWTTKFRLQHAKILLYQGRYRDALLLLDTPLVQNSADITLAISRNTLLSIAYKRTGDAARATQALASAEKLCPDELSCSGVRLAQGIVAIDNDKFGDADHAFYLSLASANASGDRFLEMQSLLDLGVVALRQEHYDEALDRFKQASLVANAIGARQALEKATGNIGWALYKLGDFKHALGNSQLAEQQAAALGSPIDQVNWLNDSGLSQYRLEELAAAKVSYEHSLQLARSIQNTEEMSDALVALASLSLQTNDLPDALARSREAQQIAEQRGNTSDTLQPALIEALVLERQGHSSAARTLLLALEQRSIAKPSIRWEIENALASVSANTGDRLSAETWFQRAIQTFHVQRSSLSNIDSRLPFVENGTTLYLSYVQYLIHNGKVIKALRTLDQGRAETLGEGLAAHPPTASAAETNPNEVARHLHATILVYCLRPTTSYLWAITPERSDFVRLPGKEVILPLIESHTRAILSSKDVLTRDDAPGATLYRQLVEPAGNLIPPQGEVYIIADQEMNGLNFETLISTHGKPHFWIEDASILNAKSLALLLKSKAPSAPDPARKRLLLVGDPIYDGSEFQKLPHASEEVSGVAAHFPPEHRIVLTGPQATPAAYQLSHPRDFAYIHFVAHATASEINPLDSAVILSSQTREAESYKLYARAILNQRLDADLVTISSCFGSGVRAYSGEGLVGLAWAFLRAGSHNVIGALWEVDDVSTPQLMRVLYDGLANGDTPATALRLAKLEMIHNSGVFRKPFYWAPFQLYVGA